MYSQAGLKLVQTENTVSTRQAKQFQKHTEIIAYSQCVHSLQAQQHCQRQEKVPARSSFLIFPENVIGPMFLLLEAQWAGSVVLAGLMCPSSLKQSFHVLSCYACMTERGELLNRLLCVGTGRNKNWFALVHLACAAYEIEVQYVLSWTEYFFCSLGWMKFLQ